jgi:hypothetical protein
MDGPDGYPGGAILAECYTLPTKTPHQVAIGSILLFLQLTDPAQISWLIRNRLTG